jgi:N-acetylglutamate synthase-like GNAT family acetyltransferase
MSIIIRAGLKPGDLGYITYLHGKIYAEEYGFDTSFEPYVASPLSEFSLSENQRQKIWIVEKADEIVGCIAIVDAGDNLAQLRWLLLTKEARGQGIGKKLMKYAIDYCSEQGFEGVFLWTVDLLEAAAGLYCSHGFRVTEEKRHRLWGLMLNEQRYDLKL